MVINQLTAMNTDSLLMCYNLFWFAAQHSPSASSHSNANDDDDDGEAEDEDDKSEDVATIEIVNPIGTKFNLNWTPVCFIEINTKIQK